MGSTSKKEDTRYGIGAVARLTGLTDHTIRVWERRYKAVVAERTASGRRAYTSADTEKLGLLKNLTDQGIAISQIAGNSIDELRALARDMTTAAPAAAPSQIRAAILGDFLPGQFAVGDDGSAVTFVAAAASRDRLLADLRHETADVLVYETATLDAGTLGSVRDILDDGGIERAVVVYGFGRRQDEDRLRDASIAVLRSPVTADDVLAAIARTYVPSTRHKPAPDTADDAAGDSDWNVSGDVAPRRYNQQQLAALAATSTAVDCECPQHLAQLVRDLSAFEVYSDQCANRNDDDEALHRYLHHTTSRARALIETALHKVAVAEGIDV